MKHGGWLIRSFVISSVLMFCVLPATTAADIDVAMRLNDTAFVSFEHFKAELYMNNSGQRVPNACIFGIIEILGEYFFWPSFRTEVDFGVQDIEAGESTELFLEFDFPDVDAYIPFGPMMFCGAWFVDIETWNYDYKQFWLATHAPGDLYDKDPIVGNMMYVPAGTFTQGSPETEPWRDNVNETQFTHTLTRNLVVMETEITRQMWADLGAVQPTLPDDPSIIDYSPTMNHPVQMSTWYEAVLFANLLSLQNGYRRCYYTNSGFTTPIELWNYTTGPFYCDSDADGYRLPTEGEWEYFTRTGTTGAFSCDEPNYNSVNCLWCFPGTHPTLEQYCVYCANEPGGTEVVGSKLPNPWNLKDVHGNVYEWCWDWYAADYPTGTVNDYVGPGSGSDRVFRGGSWSISARYCRSANRSKFDPSFRRKHLGFRLVRTVSSADG